MSSTIYVTHVEPMGPFVKICGQTSRQTMEDIESMLRHMHLMLMTHRLEPLLNEINSTDIYLVQASKEALFRRCNALDVKRNGLVKVFLIDYGQELDVHVSQMQLVSDSQEGGMLLTIPAQVQYGILAGVYLANDMATIRAQLTDDMYMYVLEDRIESVNVITLLNKMGLKVNESLVFQSLVYPISPADQANEIRQHFVALAAEKQRPNSHFAVEAPPIMPTPPPTTRGLVPSRPLNAATQYTMAGQQHSLQSRLTPQTVQPVQQLQPPSMHQSHAHSPATTRGLVPARPLKLITTRGHQLQDATNMLDQASSSSSASSASSATSARIPLLPPRNLNYRPNITIAAPTLNVVAKPLNGSTATAAAAAAAAALAPLSSSCQMPTFNSNSLLVKSRHRVYVAYIEDGPSLFSIHLKAHEHDLDQMMSALGNYPLENLNTKPMLGMACVARYADDSNLYRAVIMNIRPTSCLVAYVDYGNTGDVPFADIYQIPAHFLSHQIFAMRFTLSGYQQLLPLSREVDRLFRALVQDAELELVVRPLDGPPCVQYCELYAQPQPGQPPVSVFERLLALKSAHRHYPAAAALREQELVIIRCIESAKHFYVQSCQTLAAYEQMMRALQAYGQQQAAVATHAPARPGEPCMVWHKLNKEWNRAEVIEVLAADERRSERPNVIMQYVDIGSVDEARADELKQLPGEFLALPRQVVECCLESFVNVASVSKLTLNQMEMLADREDGQPRSFKVNICAALGEVCANGGQRQALVVNLIDASETPILDLSQRVFMMCMPPKEFRAYEQQRYHRLTSGGDQRQVGGVGRGDEAVVVTTPGVAIIDERQATPLLNSTTLITPEQSPVEANVEQSINNSSSNWDRSKVNQSKQSNWRSGRQQENEEGGGSWQQQHQQQEQQLQQQQQQQQQLQQQQQQQLQLQQQQQQLQQQQQQQHNLQTRRSNERATKATASSGSTTPSSSGNSHDSPVDDRQPTPKQQHKSKEMTTVPSTDEEHDSSGHFSQSTGSTSSVSDALPITVASITPASDDRTPHPSTISYWKSPLEFYVQPKETHDAFVAMMKQMQDHYRSRTQPAEAANGSEIGSFVVCRKSQNYFRAQLVPTLDGGGGGGTEIQYIDTGDRAPLQADHIWPLDRCFAQLARHAIRCSLADIVLAVDKVQIARHVQRYVGKGETVHTTFVGKQQTGGGGGGDDEAPAANSSWLVDVNVGDESLKELLIREGLLTPIPDGVSMPCLVGQTLVIDIRNTQQPERFTGTIFGCKPDQVLVFATNQPLPAGAEHVTAHIDALNDENVLEITVLHEPPPFLVSGLLAAPLLSGHFFVQVVKVDAVNVLHLQNVAHAEDGDRLINEMFETYEATGPDAVAAPLVGPLRTRQLCAGRSLADGNWYRCIVERLPSADTPLVTVRFIDYGNCEELPRAQLRELLPKYRRPDTLALKCYLALRATGDEQATLDKVVTLTNGWALELTVLDQYAGHCIVDIEGCGRSLINVVRDFGLAEPVDLATVRAQIDADVRRLRAIEVETVMPVEVPVVVAPVPVETTPAPPALAEEPLCNIYENRIECYLSHTDRPDRFYLRRVADEPALEQMQENIQIVAASLPDLDDYSVGTLCIVKYSGDDLWYRATIIDSGSGITSVQFIDYGNTDTITQSGYIKAMNEAFRHIAAFAIACMLPLAVNCAPGRAASSEWPEEACQVMRGLLDDKLAFEFLTTGANCSVVSLWAPPDRDVSLQLAQAGYARPVPYIPSGQTAFVSHVNSLSDFYIQMAGETNSLEIVADYLRNIEQFEELRTFEANTICTARFAEDGDWYRARILSHAEGGDDGTEVLFIDYGNTSTVHELRALPANIAQLPHLSRQCSLQRPADVALWSDEAERRFQEIANSGATVFSVRLVMPSSRASVVQMLYAGDNVEEVEVTAAVESVDLSTELAALCNKFCLAEVDQLNTSMVACTLGAGVAGVAAAFAQPGTVSWVNSAQDFFVRLDGHREQFAVITKRLAEEAEGWPPVRVLNTGDLCAAKSPLDGRFHRATIAEISSEGYLVKFIDYGNVATATHLCELPADLAAISQLATQCALVDADETPGLSEAEFTDLSVSANEMPFYFEIVERREAPSSPSTCVVRMFRDAKQKVEIRVAKQADAAPPAVAVAADVVTSSDETTPLAIGTDFCAPVCWTISSNDFYLHPAHLNATLAQVAERLLSAIAIGQLVGAEIGELCAARFEEDGVFYRARILAIDAEKAEYHVVFVDYGNEATVTDIRVLPDELRELDVCAVRCALQPAGAEAPLGSLTEAQYIEMITSQSEALFFRVVGELADRRLVRMWSDEQHELEVTVVQTVQTAE